MFLKTLNTQSVQTAKLFKIIEEAKMAEICRDLKSSIKAFKPIWEDVETDPDFSIIQSPAIQAELYRLAGFFLSFCGKSQSKKDYQSRAKVLLTKAINLFLDLNLKEKSDEAHIMLALCYWYSGDAENSDNILSQVETEYEDNPFDAPYLQVKITRAITHWSREEFEEALKVIESLSELMKFSTDNTLKMSYHNKAGAMYQKMGFLDKAISHYKKGIVFSIELGSSAYQGMQYNNLAVVYRKLARENEGFYVDAFENLDKALEIFNRNETLGWIASAEDTKSAILFQQGKYQEALDAVNRAINIMRQGDDFAELVESLFLSFKINVALNNYLNAISNIHEATEISRLHIGDYKIEQLQQRFMEAVHFKTDSTLEEVSRFKKIIVKDALLKNNHHRQKSADALGITRGGLYDILKDEIPSIVDELGIKIRHWGPTSKEKTAEKIERIEKSTKLKVINQSNHFQNKGTIKEMTVNFDQMIYPGKKEADKSLMRVFYIPRELGEVAHDDDSVVLCKSTIDEFTQAKSLIILSHKKSKTYLLALAGRNDINKSVYVQDIDTGVNLNLSDFKIVGKIIGFCSSMESVGEVIVFKSFGGN